MKFGSWTMLAALSVTLVACGEASDEDVVADYVAGVDEKYADEANCIAEELTAAVGTNQMEKWATKIKEEGKIGTLNIGFATNLSSAAKKCLKD